MLIRGVSTLSGSSSPLIVVDGFPYQGGLESLNPYDIESITLLKDAASASIYGAKSANGVIVVTTKRGKSEKLRFTYDTNFEFGEKKDIAYYMNRASSSDMVDVEMRSFEEFKDFLKSWQAKFEQGFGRPNTRSKAMRFLLENKEGRLSDADLKKELDKLRNTDNLEDQKKLLLQNPFYMQHNLSADYATGNMKIRSSLNYYKNQQGVKGSKSSGVNYTANTYIDVSKKLRFDLLANFNMSQSESFKTGVNDILRLSPYERFWDEAGNPLAVTLGRGDERSGVYGGKDAYEIERLKKLGLLDETYVPAVDYGLSKSNYKNWGARFQGQMNLTLLKGLEANVGFNITKSSSRSTVFTDKNSWEMRDFINNLTKIKKDANGKVEKGEVLVPMGHKMSEVRTDNTDYLLRGQLQYRNTFDEKHKIIVLAGSEIQANKSTATGIERLGYNSKSNMFNKFVDYKTLRKAIADVFYPGGETAVSFADYFSEGENRYFSLYGNMNYTFDDKYIIHGSVRIDQSNLFGTNPKYRFKPLWSLGGKWRVGNEEFFKNDIISQLDLQMSYGINGNISNESGPFDFARPAFAYNSGAGETLRIYAPGISDLRWEKTNTFNFGVHTKFFKERLGLDIDYYRKKTIDVYADTEVDATLGFGTLKRNDATLVNNGIEVALNTVNIRTDDFEWATFFGFNYNKSKVLDAYIDKKEYAYRIAGRPINMSGYAPNSFFVFKYAGVDENGVGLLEQKTGKKTAVGGENFSSPSVFLQEDLINAGSVIPSMGGRLTNNLRYKNLEFSFMLSYQGGHILVKDSYNGGYVGLSPGTENKEIARAWVKKGDEKKPGVLPKINSTSYESLIRNTTKNILPADYIRLRDVVLRYSLPESVTKRLKYVERVTFNLQGRNLFLWTRNKEGIDPEAHGLGYRLFPVHKSVSAGINVTF